MFQNDPNIFMLPGVLDQEVIDEMYKVADQYDEETALTEGDCQTSAELKMAFEMRGLEPVDFTDLDAVEKAVMAIGFDYGHIDSEGNPEWIEQTAWNNAMLESVYSMRQTRRCKKIPIDLNVQPWISSMITHHGQQANYEWGFDIWAADQAEFLEYGELGDKYDWHQDTQIVQPWNEQKFDRNPTCARKITLIWQLSDTDEYEGGDLEITDSFDEHNLLQDHTAAMRMKGTVLAFPSYMLHRITPITRGVRRSMVSWIGGPSWR